MSLQPIPKQMRELRVLTNSQNGVIITEEERMMINTTRAKTPDKRDKEAWDANKENAVDAYISVNQTRVLACEAFRVHSSTLIRHVEAKRNGTTVRTKTR
jgi:hypothetical protein